jgi:predicted nucleotidyltransferase
MFWEKTVRSIEFTKGQEWIRDNTIYAVLVGSHAYGTNRKDSDFDIYGVTIPPVQFVYPSRAGYVPGFSRVPIFEQFQHPGLKAFDKDVDLVIYNIVKYFKLCAECNPNMVDSLFVPENCIIHMTDQGRILRENRHLFLSKIAKHKFMGYAFSEMKKIRNKSEPKNPYRSGLVRKHGYDTKSAMHLVRLVEECKQILTEGDIDLQRNNEKLKAVRDGRYSLEALESWFHRQEELIDELYHKSDLLPHSPRMECLEGILKTMLETAYGKGVVNE